jgi:endonuclease V-like protein UPF0215 family
MGHDVIIWLAVLIIIGLQIKIFLETKKKISSYESIMKNPHNFKTYKVYIPENEIETIESQQILDNLNHYSRNPELLAIDKIEKVNEEYATLFSNDDFEA